MAVIFFLSTSLFGAEETASVVEWVLRKILPWLDQPDIHRIHLVIRKAAHVTEYAVLCILWWKGLVKGGASWAKAASLAFFISALYAASDEFHQSFVANRTPSPVDVLIDMTGAALALLIVNLIQKQRVH
jgi:VanZ family protein